MEAGDSIVPEDDDTARGGILSTLESVRQRKPAQRSPRGASARKVPGERWQSRALLMLMGAGVVSLMAAFVMVVRQGHERTASPEAQIEREVMARVAGDAASGVRDLNVLASPAAGTKPAAAAAPVTAQVEGPSAPPTAAASASNTAPTDTAARIENTHGQAPAAAVVSAATPPKAAQPPVAQRASAAAPVTAAPAGAGPSATSVTPAAPTATKPPAATRTAKAAPTRKRADDDVALIEAMLSHTSKPSGPPAAGPNVGEQIRNQCANLAGAQAATCRARICVNNPGAAACQ